MSLALTTGQRTLAADGSRFDHLFEDPRRDDLIIIQDGSVEQTVQQMVKLVKKYSYQTARLAKMLQGSTIEESTRNIWNFIYRNIQYREDKAGVEQLRTPARTWADRKNGVDCDCMSIFAGSLLTNMGIDYQFRIVKYGKPDFQHVYVVVPRPGINGRYIVIDGVLDKYNTELQFTDNKDFNGMNGIPIQVLNGIEGQSYDETRLLAFIKGQRQAVINNPDHLTAMHWRNALEFFDYILQNWTDPHNRATAIQQVAEAEKRNFPQSGLFATILAYVEGRANCDAVRAAAWMRDEQPALAGKNNAAIVLFAPARGAYLALLKLNAFRWADKMAPGFFGGLNDDVANLNEGHRTWDRQYRAQYAAAFGMTVAEQKRTRDNLFKLLTKWHDKLGGDWSAIKTAVMQGSQKLRKRVENLPGYRYWYNYQDWGNKPTGTGTAQNPLGIGGITPEEYGINGLGDGGATAAILTAAAAVIASVAGFVKEMKTPGFGDTTIPEMTNAELAAIQAQAASQTGSTFSMKTVGIIAGVVALFGGLYILFQSNTNKSRNGRK
ncbi:hypothetical protein SDC9_17678 [bioreactor metagenome]|uniref:Transglutaminase-like domain-containing protein n=1 Tax=bioreactor metagenome TaxID=1076179 RepID=A0A644TZ21_9ZZZZ|nr:transglutaminase-like domain-containing protein [Lentimicrobium sp.]MEA5111684.1 hypothetical protein [Lentimicrobium sp.]